MLFPILGLVGAAGAIISAVLLIIMILREKSILLPGILLLVSALLVGVSVFMIIREESEPADKSSVDQSTVDQSEPDKSKPDKPDTSQDKASSENDQTQKDVFGVGEEVNMNDVIVTLNSVTESSGKQFLEPEDGNVYILCEFTIENNSKKELNISSMLCFDGYIDDYSSSMSISAQTSSDKSQLDGTVAAGKKMNGVIGYEASKDWKEVEIHFTPDFWRNKEIVFVHSR